MRDTREFRNKAGFPVLVDETANTDLLAGSEPPQPIGEIAAIMLAMGSGQPFDIAPSAASRKTWSEWYAANAGKLTFDPQRGWSTR